MICPHCGGPVYKTKTGNWPNGALGVAEFYDSCTEGYDFDISLWQCQLNTKHIFYADDGAGNGQ